MARAPGTDRRRSPLATGKGPRSRRVFLALWPDAGVRCALNALAGSLQAECGGRAMREANIHLTLVFVGNVAPERVADLARLASGATAPPFELVIDLVRYWRHNRLVWAGASETPNALVALVGTLSANLRSAGFGLEERDYRPHVTLVRDVLRSPAPRVIEPIIWHAADFALIESSPGAAGSQYDVLARWPLNG